VVEARSAAGKFFGEERLAALLASCPPDPDEVVRRTAAALAEFTRGTEAYDDLTLLAIARAALVAAPPPEEIRGEIPKEIPKEIP
jgi:serine phosphatase RsbU (regulator of sigma subunit)